MGSAFKQQLSEEGKAAEQLLEAGQTTSDPKPATPMSPPIAGALTATNKAAASSNSSSISPQPPVQLRNGMSQAQQGPDLPRPAAPAAQSLDPAAQEGGPWQEAKASRRKTGSRQTASMAGARKGPKQDRGAPGQHTAGPSLSPLRAAQVVTREPQQIHKNFPELLHPDLHTDVSLVEQVLLMPRTGP